MAFPLVTAYVAVHTVIPNPHTLQICKGGSVDKP
jgi:hypothetical protein